MSNKLYEESDIQDIADSIRAKNGTATTYKVSEMAAAIDALPSGVTLSNGKIEQMYSGSYGTTTIPANRFVQFNYYGRTNSTSGNGNFYSIVIDTNKIVNCTYVYSSSSTPKLKLRFFVETLSNHKLTSGEPIEVPLGDNSSSAYKIVKISSTEILLIHRNTATEINCVPISINGYTLTAGEQTTIISGISTYSRTLDCVYIGSNKFVVIYDKNSSNYLWGTAFTYSNGTYTLGTETQLTTTSGSNFYGKLEPWENDKILVCYSGSSGYTLKCELLEISNLSISAGTELTIASNTNAAVSYGMCKISSDKIIIAFLSGSTSSTYCSACVITLSDSTLTKGSNTILRYNGYMGCEKVKLIYLAENTALLTYYDISTSFVYEILYLNGTSIQQKAGGGLHTNYNGQYAYNSFPMLVDTGKIIVVNYDSLYMVEGNYLGYIEMDWSISGTTYEVEIYKRISLPYTALFGYGEKRIDGFTLSEVTQTTAGDVYILNS